MRFGDRVLETTTITGTGSYVLAGAAVGHETFLDVIGAASLVGYVCVDATGYEVGYGTLSAGPATLTRDAILASSNGGSAVNWGAGDKYIYSAPIASLFESLLRTHKGSAAPAWLPEGGLWVDDSASPWLLMLKLASGSQVLGRIDATGLRYLVERTKGADLASAATVNLSAALGDLVHITGTTTITSFGSANQGTERTLVFDGALTLTHSANLILPGAANITTAAGDVAVVRSEGAGVWRLVSYQRASGRVLRQINPADLPAATTSVQGAVELATEAETLAFTDPDRAVPPLALALLGAPDVARTLSTSSGGTATITDLPKCRAWMIVFDEVSHSSGSNQTIRVQVSDDNGSSWSGTMIVTPAGSAAVTYGTWVWVTGTGVTGNKYLHAHSLNQHSAGNSQAFTTLITSITGVIDAFRISPSGGNLDNGQAIFYGWR